jgi:hypothetical protein
MRILLGVAALVAAVVITVRGFHSVPDASTCALINGQQRLLGGGPTCSTTPSVWWWIAAGVCALAGVVLLASGIRSGRESR